MPRELPIDEHKVVRLLDELMPSAATAQRSGVSFDVRLYFRENPDGSQWAEVAFIHRATGKLMHTGESTLPLSGTGVVSWFFGEIAKRGFPMAVDQRTVPRKSS